MTKTLTQWVAHLQRFADRVWYFPLVSFLVGMDLFVLFVPSDGLLVSSVLLRPKRWVRAAVWVSLGSAVGALALTLLIQWDASLITEEWLPFVFESAGWESTASFIEGNGAWALALFSFSLFPQQPAVAVAALAGMSPWTILGSVALGRFVKYGLLAYCASHAPKYLKRIWFVRKELQQLQKAKAQP